MLIINFTIRVIQSRSNQSHQTTTYQQSSQQSTQQQYDDGEYYTTNSNQSQSASNKKRQRETREDEGTGVRIDICNEPKRQSVNRTPDTGGPGYVKAKGTWYRARKCHKCDKTFPWASSLRRHLMTHTGLKPYCCAACKVN